MTTATLALQVNGEARTFPAGTTVLDAVGTLLGRELRPDGRAADGGSLGVAVALDEVVVPRSRWAGTALTDGQQLEIVTAVQGG
ncbi:sulfur carrier protein ThiS [Ammonicoccus fulvus]|uniref:Sulfur carrier protein ThiS n=1 Tax=Ammonicoccus fulvus TaxID=3138240 RepID=A0ABZ3FTI0_9ACTN